MNRTDNINTNERFLNNSEHNTDDETLENLYLITSQKIDSLYEYLNFLKQYDEELEKHK